MHAVVALEPAEPATQLALVRLCWLGLTSACPSGHFEALPRVDDRHAQFGTDALKNLELRVHVYRALCAWEHFNACERLVEHCLTPNGECALDGDVLPAIRRAKQRTRLVSEGSGDFALSALPEARLLVLREDDAGALVMVDQYQRVETVPELEPDGTISDRWLGDAPLGPWSARVPSAALAAASAYGAIAPQQKPGASLLHPTSGKARLAFDHARALVSSPSRSTRAIATNCGAIEVLGERSFGNHSFQKLRQVTNGIELSGWTIEPIRTSWGQHQCAARSIVLTDDEHGSLPWFSFAGVPLERARVKRSAGTPGSEPYVLERYELRDVPTGFQRVDPSALKQAVTALRSTKTFYAIETFEGGAECLEHTLSGTELRFSFTTQTGMAQEQRVIEYASYLDDWGSLDLDGPSVRTFVNGEKAKGLVLGCTNPFRVVGQDGDSFHLLAGYAPVFAYHPDDAIRWFRSRKACDAHLAARPRVPLEPRDGRLALGAPRVRGGC